MNGLNQSTINGMTGRSQGKGVDSSQNTDWKNGWHCMDAQIMQLLKNAEWQLREIAIHKA